ncbi:MAG: DUF2949 domain-containing protein [Xenococcus sp. MO_188.B8]|nr:DUF2949 domain-containing protein [Xenococcus sp. MO_188.B8]
MLKNSIYKNFTQFLKEELAMPADALEIAQKAIEENPGPIPMILWQYGLVNLEELDRIYDWLETV